MTYVKDYIFVFIAFFAIAMPSFTQNHEIDSLKEIIPSLNNDEKVSALIDLAYAYDAIMELDLAQENATMALNLVDKHSDLKSKANIFNLLATISLKRDNLNSAEINADKAILIGLELQNANILALAYYSLGLSNYSKSNYQVAKKNWNESLKYYREIGDKDFSAQILSLLGVIYKNWSEYNDAIEHYQEALAIYKETNNLIGMARVYSYLGNLYFYSEIDYDNALENYEKALTVFNENGMKEHEANILISIGLVYNKKKLNTEAINQFTKGLKIAEEIGSDYWKAQALSKIGNIYLENKEFDSALNNYDEALKIFEKQESKKDVAIVLLEIGMVYHSSKKYDMAREYFEESMQMCKDLGLRKELLDIYKELSQVLAETHDFENAFKFHKLYAEQKDSIFNVEYTDMMTEWNARFENGEKEAQLREQEITFQEELKRKNVIVYSAVMGIFTVLVFSYFLYQQFRAKKHANILLKDQNDEIKQQRDKIFQQNQEITDSIEYASKIQSAMLPPRDYISSVLPEHFVLYRPRDIVSGDFYWLNKFNNKVYFCAADCTGHGVPGAFMSMLGIALLNEIINKKGDFSAADILNNLRAQVVKSMHQSGQEGETQDGMDIAFCVLDFDKRIVQFSGAFNPLFLIRNGELVEFKGDKMPIGVHLKQEVPFTNHDVEFLSGDQIYVFSDGYVDQFGGPNRKKYLIRRFRELLLNIHTKKMAQQKVALENEIDEWMGGYDQIDDILVFGAKLT